MKVRAYANLGFSNEEIHKDIEFEDEELEELNEEERNEIINNAVQEWAISNLDTGFTVIKDSDN